MCFAFRVLAADVFNSLGDLLSHSALHECLPASLCVYYNITFFLYEILPPTCAPSGVARILGWIL